LAVPDEDEAHPAKATIETSKRIEVSVFISLTR